MMIWALADGLSGWSVGGPFLGKEFSDPPLGPRTRGFDRKRKLRMTDPWGTYAKVLERLGLVHLGNNQLSGGSPSAAPSVRSSLHRTSIAPCSEKCPVMPLLKCDRNGFSEPECPVLEV